MTFPRRSASCVLALLIVLLAGGPASAHEEVPGVRNVLDAVEPPLPAGVTIQVRVSAADQLVVENRTATDLTILGEAGEPFLRIGPAGVLANVLSPAWHLSNDPEGARVPPEADAKATPRWGRVSREPSWGWFDHRLHRTRLAAPPAAQPGQAVTLESWTVPARYGTTAVQLRGHREYVRPGGAFRAAVTAAPEGTTATVLPGVVPGLLVQATGSGTVLVQGAEGEPMVRFTSAGTEVNEASPTWALTVRAKTGALPAGEVGAGATPRWVQQSTSRSLLWLEPRARYDGELPPESALAASSPTTVLSWTVPAQVDGKAATLRGETQWVPEGVAAPAPAPARERSSVPPWVLGGGAALLLAAAALVLRRRTA